MENNHTLSQSSHVSAMAYEPNLKSYVVVFDFSPYYFLGNFRIFKLKTEWPISVSDCF